MLQPWRIVSADTKYGEYAEYEVASVGDTSAVGPLYYPDKELMYDFDSNNVPNGVSTAGGSIAASDKYYIVQSTEGMSNAHSLKWDTAGVGSTLTFPTNGFRLSNDGFWGTGTLYHYSVGILREALADGVEVPQFSFVLNTDCGTFTYPIKLNCDGWNFLSQQIERDKMKSDCEVTSIVLKQTAGAECDVYIDNLIIAMGAEVRGIERGYIGEGIAQAEVDSKYPVHSLTQEEIDGFRVIENRVLPSVTPIEMLPADKMKEYKEFYESWNITFCEANKFANGLYPSYYYNTVPGTANSDGYGGTAHLLSTRAASFSKQFRNISKSYAAVKDEEQRAILGSYVVGLGRLALTYSNVPEPWYSGSGFAEGCYYGKEALESAGILNGLYQKLKRQYGIERLLYAEHSWGNESAEEMKATADDFINNYSSNLIVLLMAADSPEKARDFYRFQSFLDNVMYQFSPGTDGVFKPDGSLFHHGVNKYDYGWKDAFNNGLTLYPYYLSGTVYALADETMERIEMINDVRFKVADADGRVGTNDQISVIDSAGSMYLSKVTPFNPKYAAQWFYFGGMQDDGLKNVYESKGISKPDSPNTNVTLSYAATNVHRRDDWKIQTYGNNNLMFFNEYVRPAFIFYNLGGISLDINGECSAMQNTSNGSIDGRHGFDLAAGYNVNLAPGVTAPEIDPKLCEQPSHQTGSSEFVGGVSTKNGCGVFTNQFDLSQAENKSSYSNTGITEFKFKKSYFYFDDKVLCLGSNIGCSNENVTTGVMQEKADSSDEIVTQDGAISGEFSKTFSSNSSPWIIDNKNKAGYYFYPNQSYTVKNGEQSFVYGDDERNYSGNFAAVYINHKPERISAGNASYAYAILPKADAGRMSDFTHSQPIEIVRMDTKAHIARDTELGMTGYVIFDSNVNLVDSEIVTVNSPSVIMTREIEEGRAMSIAVADPNLRIDDKATSYSREGEVSFVVAGKWSLKDSTDYLARETAKARTLVNSDGNTLVTVSCKDGLTNEYLLEKIDEQLSENTKTIVFNTSRNSISEIYGNELTNRALRNVLIKRNDTVYVSVDDASDLLEVDFVVSDAQAVCNYNGLGVIFTNSSNAVSIDGNIDVLENNVFSSNGTMYIPISVFETVFGYDTMPSDIGIRFAFNGAEWKAWDNERR